MYSLTAAFRERHFNEYYFRQTKYKQRQLSVGGLTCKISYHIKVAFVYIRMCFHT